VPLVPAVILGTRAPRRGGPASTWPSRDSPMGTKPPHVGRCAPPRNARHSLSRAAPTSRLSPAANVVAPRSPRARHSLTRSLPPTMAPRFSLAPQRHHWAGGVAWCGRGPNGKSWCVEWFSRWPRRQTADGGRARPARPQMLPEGRLGPKRPVPVAHRPRRVLPRGPPTATLHDPRATLAAADDVVARPPTQRWHSRRGGGDTR